MRVRLLATAAPLALLLTACGASTGTGTDTEPSLDGQAPGYEVLSEEAGDDGLDLTVAVDEAPVETAVDSLVAELQQDYSEDGVYDLEVVCQGTDEALATATWATGDAALEATGLAEGEIDSQVDADATCEP